MKLPVILWLWAMKSRLKKNIHCEFRVEYLCFLLLKAFESHNNVRQHTHVQTQTGLVRLDRCTDRALNLPPPCFNWLVLLLPCCQDNTEVERCILMTSRSQNRLPPEVTRARLRINPTLIEDKSSVGRAESTHPG